MANNTIPSKINYNSRDFSALREDLINYVKNYHYDKFQYFNDASTDMMYLELLAYVTDGLNYQTDKAFNEAFRETAQSRESLIRIAQDNGFYNYHPKGSVTQAVVSIDVPAIPNENGSAMVPDARYLVALYSGMQAESNNGSMFECLEEINFASGDRRSIVPNYDSNNQLINFTINKAVKLNAGVTKVQRFYVNSQNAQPFLEVFLDDASVTEVIGVVPKVGNILDLPKDEEFRDLDNVYVEVQHLAEDKIFLPINPVPPELSTLVNKYTDMTLNYGQWVNKPKRFIVRRDNSNRTRLVFGSTLINYDSWNKLVGTTDISKLTTFTLNQVLNNYALGEVPDIDTTLFIQYRSGAGVETNSLSNEITNIISKNFVNYSTAADFAVLDKVRASLKISSNLPAVGGSDAMTNEEIRHSIGKIFATNDRAVTYEDVKALVNQMPAKFGTPFRISYEEIKPKVLAYSQVRNYIQIKLEEMLALNSTTERENKAFEINMFLQKLPTETVQITQSGVTFDIGTTSKQILPNTPSLWLGEKCRLYVLGIDQDYHPTGLFLDSDGVWRSKNTMIKENIKNYLISKRVMGDWIDVVDADIVNFQVEFTILADNKNKQRVLIDCLTKLRDYFNVYNWQMNQPIFIANVQTILQQIDGVINVVDIKFWNVFGVDTESGKEYSPAQFGRYFNNTTKSFNNSNNKFQMAAVDNVIQSKANMFMSVKYPENDIIGKVM